MVDRCPFVDLDLISFEGDKQGIDAYQIAQGKLLAVDHSLASSRDDLAY